MPCRLMITLMTAFTIALAACNGPSQEADKTEIRDLLERFLEGASESDAEIHDRFWSEDLIYTSSSGERYGKAAIMEGLENGDTPDPDEPSPVYSAEEVEINVYGDTAVLAFKLVADTGPNERDEFWNTGTLVRQDEAWRTVAWQATRIGVD